MGRLHSTWSLLVLLVSAMSMPHLHSKSVLADEGEDTTTSTGEERGQGSELYRHMPREEWLEAILEILNIVQCGHGPGTCSTSVEAYLESERRGYLLRKAVKAIAPDRVREVLVSAVEDGLRATRDRFKKSVHAFNVGSKRLMAAEQRAKSGSYEDTSAYEQLGAILVPALSNLEDDVLQIMECLCGWGCASLADKQWPGESTPASFTIHEEELESSVAHVTQLMTTEFVDVLTAQGSPEQGDIPEAVAVAATRPPEMLPRADPAPTTYGPDGFDSRGFDRDVFDRSGRDIAGFDRTGRDREGYDRRGFSADGWNRGGFDQKGFNRDGRDKDGFFRDGFNKGGYDRAGYDRNGKDKRGYDRRGFNDEGRDRGGFDRGGFDTAGRDRGGYDRDGYDRTGYDRDGRGRDGYNRDGRDRNGLDRAGLDKEGFDRSGFNKDGFNREGRGADGTDLLPGAVATLKDQSGKVYLRLGSPPGKLFEVGQEVGQRGVMLERVSSTVVVLRYRGVAYTRRLQ